MGTQQRGGDLLAPVAAVRRFYQTMSTRRWEWRTPKVEREIRGVKFAPSSILAADCADYTDGPRLLAANPAIRVIRAIRGCIIFVLFDKLPYGGRH